MMPMTDFLLLTINPSEAIAEYAKKLGDEAAWLKLMDAYRWFHRGGRLRRFWRHNVYRRLRPCRYEERRLQAEDAERHIKRAVIVATVERTGGKNWRWN